MRMTAVLAAASLAGVASLAAGTASASADTTYPLSGKQTVVNEDKGLYKMSGSLIGRWNVTSFEESVQDPYYHGSGTEEFKGCLDRRRDGRCKHDPSGTLSITFEYWALFGSDDPASLVWGACWHPVVSGTGDFAGASGVLTMVDTPTKQGVKTAYIGNLTLKGKGKATRRAQAHGARAAGAACGAAR
jgi:hypothetical protein